MSQSLINHRDDLSRLRNEGYDIEIRSGHLLLKHVPYVDVQRIVQFGTLVSPLEDNGVNGIPLSTHWVRFSGSLPCDKEGVKLEGELVAETLETVIDSTLSTSFMFSRKPVENGQMVNYTDFYQKMTTYAYALFEHAIDVDPTCKVNPFLPAVPDFENPIFLYDDIASSRAGITAANEKLQLEKIAIVGLGGTGSYVLDHIVKCPVREIHLFDSDIFSSHNAFRSPGAASWDELSERPFKVDYFKKKYEVFRTGIHTHGNIDQQNTSILKEMDFVFLCVDEKVPRGFLIKTLEDFGVPFIEVGMGLLLQENNSISGTLSTALSDIKEGISIPVPEISDENEIDDLYSTNIQVSDLNALNAAFAVIRWKKRFGFYSDMDNEKSSAYMVEDNYVVNEI